MVSLARDYFRKEGGSIIALLVIVLLFGLSFAYTSVQTFDPAQPLGYTDTKDYLEMYHGRPGTGIRGYRVLVPSLARALSILPAPSSAVFRSLRNPESIAVMHFAVVNLAFLLLSCLALYYLQRGFAFTRIQAMGGTILFLGCTYVVRAITLPMTESAFYSFFLLGLIAIRKSKPWLLCVAFAAGMLAKELMILVVPFIFLTRLSWRRRSWLLISLVPGMMVYMGLRVVITPSVPDPYAGGRFFLMTSDYLLNIMRFNTLAQLFMAFSALWLPSLYALARCKVPADLRRWVWFAPIVLAGMLINGAYNFGRSSFVTFPVIIPLAVIGLSEWIACDGPLNKDGQREQRGCYGF